MHGSTIVLARVEVGAFLLRIGRAFERAAVSEGDDPFFQLTFAIWAADFGPLRTDPGYTASADLAIAELPCELTEHVLTCSHAKVAFVRKWRSSR